MVNKKYIVKWMTFPLMSGPLRGLSYPHLMTFAKRMRGPALYLSSLSPSQPAPRSALDALTHRSENRRGWLNHLRSATVMKRLRCLSLSISLLSHFWGRISQRPAKPYLPIGEWQDHSPFTAIFRKPLEYKRSERMIAQQSKAFVSKTQKI